mgnify:CR=1 FL=1
MGPNEKDDLIWMYGKIHGLENIAFLTDEQLEHIKDPITLQRAINNVRRPDGVASSYEEVIERINTNLQKYKECVDKFGFYPSDRQKMLSQPFYLMKRVQPPEPKRGQWQWNFFKELYGKEWSHYDHLEIDLEKKITEFDFE